MRLSFRRLAGILFIGVLIEAAFIAGLLLSPLVIGQSPLALGRSHPPLLDEAWGLAERTFFGTVPSDTLRTYAALHGMMSAFNDPYTVFVEPPATKLQNQQLSGKFGGIGASLRRETDGRIILAPFPDRPAAQAGVKDGDVLIEIDGQRITPEMTFDAISLLLRGDVGSKVIIKVQRGPAPLAFTITRAEIAVPSVTWRILAQAPNVGYMAINIFAATTKDEVVQAINELKQQGAQKLILDLRENGGGLFDAAIDVASQFVDGVVVIETRRGGGGTDYQAKPNGLARDLPLVVLVNHDTASASEIVSGAIQDHQRGQLIGDQTFGKGSVQNVLPLSDGSSLHVTVAQWFTPNRRQINGKGLVPDIVVGRTPQDAAAGRDPQLDRAIAALQ